VTKFVQTTGVGELCSPAQLYHFNKTTVHPFSLSLFLSFFLSLSFSLSLFLSLSISLSRSRSLALSRSLSLHQLGERLAVIKNLERDVRK